jgi:hypothetical protein
LSTFAFGAADWISSVEAQCAALAIPYQRYGCNDISFDATFDKLVFRIERV